MATHKTPKRAGIWESFDNARLDPASPSPPPPREGGERRRGQWLLLFVAIGGALLVLDLAGVLETQVEETSGHFALHGFWQLVAILLPFAAYAVATRRRHTHFPLEVTPQENGVKFALSILIALYAVYLLAVYTPSHLPSPVNSPFFLPFIGCLLLYVAAQTTSNALRTVAFYGRFIRPGLKKLLKHRGDQMSGGEKLFRGRKTVILKLDMANYTRTTFDMPYGMRRLFQDLWFTLVDRVVSEQVFLDKNLGDGSVYCFEDRLPGGSCTNALLAALEIREHQVAELDRLYGERLVVLLERTPELRPAAESYFRRFRDKTGEAFDRRQTQVRIALTTGYVDEGLWGLSSQSHYDVQGGPLVVATRLEEEAENGEIVFDDDFLAELEEESPGLLDPRLLESRHVDLKGIGEWQLYALPEHVGAEILHSRPTD